MRRKSIITLIISWSLVFISILNVSLTNTAINEKHYAGIGVLTLTTIIYFINKKVFNYIFLIILILGSINLFNFFYLRISFNLGIIEVNPIFLSLIIIFLITNSDFLNQIFKNREPTPDQNKTEKQDKKELKIKSFKKTYKNKSQEELKIIAKDNSGYVSEARIAASYLLTKNAQ